MECTYASMASLQNHPHTDDRGSVQAVCSLVVAQTAGKTRSVYLQLGHLQLSVQAQEGCWLQGEGQEVGQRVPVPVLAEDGQSHHRGTAEVATVTP